LTAEALAEGFTEGIPQAKGSERNTHLKAMG
jgi:hypothetical protein